MTQRLRGESTSFVLIFTTDALFAFGSDSTPIVKYGLERVGCMDDNDEFEEHEWMLKLVDIS